MFRQLKPLSNEEANTVLAGLPMTPELRDGIRQIADGNPALLQHAGYLLFSALRAEKIPDASSFIKEFCEGTMPILNATWSSLTALEQMLLFLVALEGLSGRLERKFYDLGNLETVYSQRELELGSLVGRGILQLVTTPTETRYYFTSSAMEWWVTTQLQTTTDEYLQARQKIFLNFMSRQQFEKVKAAFAWVWHHKDQIPSLVNLFVKVFGTP